MRITETTAEHYQLALTSYPHIYNCMEFAELNNAKVRRLHYLLFEDTKVKCGIILGERDGRLYSPFSAPFGGLTANRGKQTAILDQVVNLLKEYGRSCNMDIVITLPPTIYREANVAHNINAMQRFGKLCYVDVNYHFCLSAFNNYLSIIDRNARKHLHRSMNEEFEFKHVDFDDTDGIKRAYDIICRNREEHNYPLRMTLDDVLRTIKLVKADFFVLTRKGLDVAAAQVFHVAKGICQVIYWGDIASYRLMRPMNYLAFRLFEYYHAQGLSYVDIGPSTERGIPNIGLCDFKQSIGCDTSPKFTFLL